MRREQSIGLTVVASGPVIQYSDHHFCLLFAVYTFVEKAATALGRSRTLSNIVDREQVRLGEERSALVVDLARVVGNTSTAEAEAATNARREWWREARDSIVSFFSKGSAAQAATAASVTAGSCSQAEDSDRRETATVVVGDVLTEAGAAHLVSEVASAPTSSASLLDRLDDMIHAEEIRAADTWAAVLMSESGVLHLAVASKQQGDRDAMEACTDAFEAAREKRPSGADNTATIELVSMIPLAEGLDQFRLRLEGEAVRLVSASFEDEVRRLAEFEGRSEMVAIGEASLSPKKEEEEDEEECPSELTRSQLDLRRVARVRAHVRALGEMLTQAHEALQNYSTEVRAHVVLVVYFTARSSSLPSLVKSSHWKKIVASLRRIIRLLYQLVDHGPPAAYHARSLIIPLLHHGAPSSNDVRLPIIRFVLENAGDRSKRGRVSSQRIHDRVAANEEARRSETPRARGRRRSAEGGARSGSEPGRGLVDESTGRGKDLPSCDHIRGGMGRSNHPFRAGEEVKTAPTPRKTGSGSFSLGRLARGDKRKLLPRPAKLGQAHPGERTGDGRGGAYCRSRCRCGTNRRRESGWRKTAGWRLRGTTATAAAAVRLRIFVARRAARSAEESRTAPWKGVRLSREKSSRQQTPSAVSAPTRTDKRHCCKWTKQVGKEDTISTEVVVSPIGPPPATSTCSHHRLCAWTTSKPRVFAPLAAAEASFYADVEAWAEEARSRVSIWAKTLVSDAEAAESAARHAAETEGKALLLRFREAREEASRAAFFAPLGFDTTTPPPETVCFEGAEGARAGAGQQQPETRDDNKTTGAAGSNSSSSSSSSTTVYIQQ